MLMIRPARRSIMPGSTALMNSSGGSRDARDILSLRRIARDGQTARSGRFDFSHHLIELRFISRRYRDSRAGGGKSQSDALADASAGAGHDRYLALELSRHISQIAAAPAGAIAGLCLCTGGIANSSRIAARNDIPATK